MLRAGGRRSSEEAEDLRIHCRVRGHAIETGGSRHNAGGFSNPHGARHSMCVAPGSMRGPVRCQAPARRCGCWSRAAPCRPFRCRTCTEMRTSDSPQANVKPSPGTATAAARMRASAAKAPAPPVAWISREPTCASTLQMNSGERAQCSRMRAMSGLSPTSVSTVNPPAENPKAPTREGWMAARCGPLRPARQRVSASAHSRASPVGDPRWLKSAAI